MAGTPAPIREFECPVCHNDYAEPKMLPCTHLACRKCVVSLVGQGTEPGGCPVCRLPILSAAPSRQGDLDALVDALPTDMATMALVESHKVLRDQHICKICESSVAATAFCLQCDVKLCKNCSKGHTKLPALKNHVVELLSQLTAQRMAAHHLSVCKSHDDRPAEFYCSAHHELICMLCASTNHRCCAEVKPTDEMAKEKRVELKEQVQRLRERETVLTSQIREVRDRFKTARKKVKDTFDDLQQSVKKRRLEANSQIQVEEDAIMPSLTLLEKNRSAIRSNAGTAERLIADGPDMALLDMLSKLSSRLNELETQTANTERIGTAIDVTFDPQRLTHLKTSISSVGRVTSKPKGRQPVKSVRKAPDMTISADVPERVASPQPQ